ncbi:MAG: hypothetical protein NC044_05595 [Prevotella sp.]|nr:hypothetical protein [Lachnospiraceae bacterium]MCM1379536.1 hypothetical protein [Bacteroides sp.]MCM1445861.1 hypothetical protein [Prevotella sp.]
MATNGLTETMPGGVCCASIQYGCDSCRHSDGSEYNNRCKINPMTTVMLIMGGWRNCPLKNKSGQEIEEWLNSKDNSK